MIGFFDSGFGGLTVLRRVVEALPQYDYVYLGDNARAPYGSRSQNVVYRFTLEAVEYLFRRGCPLIIIACNTSSAKALRRIQQEYLPGAFPDRRNGNDRQPRRYLLQEKIAGLRQNDGDTALYASRVQRAMADGNAGNIVERIQRPAR